MSTDRTHPFRNYGGTDQRSPMIDSEKIGADRKIVGKFQIRKIRSESDPCRALHSALSRVINVLIEMGNFVESDLRAIGPATYSFLMFLFHEYIYTIN